VLEEWPFPAEADMVEVHLDEHDPVPDVMGRFMLQAHRDLAGLSDENRKSWAGVISALEADLDQARLPGTS
jgi:hypothetical protein